MDKKEKKAKEKRQPLSGKMRGFLGVGIAVTILAGTITCNAITTGKNPYSLVTTGNVMDRFSPEVADTSRRETASFFYQAANCFLDDANQKYTSYTLKYTCTVEYANYKQQTYTNAWREVVAAVDANYTLFTITDEYAEGLTFDRNIREYIVCKKGSNAGKIWGRYCEDDQSVGDVDILENGGWIEIKGSISNIVGSAASLLSESTYEGYDVVNGQFNFSLSKGEKTGKGYMKPGFTPTLAFSYETAGERYETAHHEWVCSYLNATKVVLPYSFLRVVGGVV